MLSRPNKDGYATEILKTATKLGGHNILEMKYKTSLYQVGFCQSVQWFEGFQTVFKIFFYENCYQVPSEGERH